MKRIIFPALIAVVITTSAFQLANNATPWSVKEDTYSVKFTSKKFDGEFKGLKTELIFDENNLSSSRITATIDANTINTGNGMRNGHAKKGLDAKTYQTVKFVSSSLTKTPSGYEASGNLTIKDVTRQIKIPFIFSKNADGGVFAGSFSVIPAEYNVTRGGTPEIMHFQINVPVTK